MGLSNDYDTQPDGEDADVGDAELSDEQYQWLQEQLAHIGHLRIEDEEESEDWVDPSGGLLLNMFEACETGDVTKLTASLADLAAAEGSQQHSVDTPGPDGDTALHLACLYGHRACVEALLTAGCRLDVVNAQDGTSALHDAAAGGYLDLVKLLLGSGGADALLQLQDADGDTALHNAARGGHLAVVQFLLDRGASPAILNAAGKTAAGEAEESAVVAALVAAAARAQQQQQQQQQQAAAAVAAAGGGGSPPPAAAAAATVDGEGGNTSLDDH